MDAEAAGAPRPALPDRVVVTHLMLRAALIGVAAAIVGSVVYQMAVDGCSLTSISAYWYTDARAVFVGGLMVIGVCLVAYGGGTWTENLLLNLAGVLAPVVAIAPTAITRQQDRDCLGARAPSSYDTAATTNGLVVYFALLLVGAAFTIGVSRSLRRGMERDGRVLSRAQRTAYRVGRAVAAVVTAGLLVWFLLDDDFARHAHFPAAALMFVFLALVAAARSDRLSQLTRRWDPYRDDDTLAAARERRRFPYSRLNLAVACGMLLTLLLAALNGVVDKTLGTGWDHGVIAAELSLLGLFLVFWVAQTFQLRNILHRSSAIGPDAPRTGETHFMA